MSMYVKELEPSDLSKGTVLLPGLLVIDFYADWCGPCKALAPHFAEVASEMEGVRFLKANIEKLPELAHQFSIRSVPTILVLEDGAELSRTVGGMSAADLRGSLKLIFESSPSERKRKGQIKINATRCSCC